MLNHVTLLGRLAQDIELRSTPNGIPVTRFDLAVPVAGKDKEAPPDYIPIVCWREQAEFVSRYLSKGRQIVVEGRVTARKYTDSEGKNRKAVEVTASRIYFADSKQNGGGGNDNDNSYQSGGFQSDGFQDAGFAGMPNDDDDLPF